MKLTTCLSIIVSIWVFSLLVTLPYGIFMSHKSNGPYYVCEEAWTDNYRKLFGAFTSIAQFVLPFFVITFCYVRVSLRLNERGRANPGARSSRREEADRERKRRTNRMLIAMVTIFGVSWLPLNLVNFLNDVYKDIGDWPYYNLCFFMVHAIAMSSTCYNPFLYAWLNENFRKEFKQVLPCFENPRHNSGLGPVTASIALTSGPRRSLGGSLGSTKGSRHGAAAACNGSNESGETRLSAAQTTTTTATYTKETEHVELRISDGEALIGDKEITVGNGEPVLEDLRPTPEATALLELNTPSAAPAPLPPTAAVAAELI
ncbi:hypothetical protein B566_EDAN013753 [Ephemera danica]|nr:hypothetical protein B566_EDAN013753 [Ephemera danica]